MKNLIHAFIIFILNILNIFAGQIDFYQNKNSAAKASLTSHSYYSTFTIGVANFSPELRLPLQMFYDSALKDEGLLGIAWKIPQLESSAIPNKEGAIWTTPWGEKVSFYSRKNSSKEVLELFKEEERENAYFSPFADWTANGRAESGSWTIFGRKDMKGWKFVYSNAKLRQITAPSGQSVEFNYVNGKLVSVEQSGRAFISLNYGENKLLSEISINGISHKINFINGKAQILPETLAGKEEFISAKFLSSVSQEGLNPLEFFYDNEGYLVQIKRGNYLDKIAVEKESLAERKEYLKSKSKDIKRKIAGRILSDANFNYSYPSDKFGNVALENKKGEVATYKFDSNRGIFNYTDFSGRTLTTYYFMRYDVAYNGKVRQIVDSRGRVIASYRYDKDSGKITRFRDLAKNDVNFKYDANGNLIQITKRAANSDEVLPVRSFSYDKKNSKPNKINELDADGKIARTTSIQYDAQLRPTFIDNGQNSLKISYNTNGFPSKIVDSFGIETEYKYDGYNRQISQTCNGIERITEYKNGFPSKAYTKFKDEILSTVSFAYDKNGAIQSYKDQDGLEKKFERDEQGRVSKEIFQDLSEVKYSYDELGNLSNVIDQNGNEIKFEWNKYGLSSRTTAVGQISQNYYDKYGRIISKESKFEGKNSDRTFDYAFDELDRLTKIYYGINEEESLKYDSWGKVIEKSKNGLVSKFKYDHFGRLVEKTEGGSATKYAYDNFGRRTSRITKIGGDVLDEYNTYDKFGRLVKTVSNGKSVEYVYDDKNRLSEQIIDGNIVKFEYTKLGQISSKRLYSKESKKLISELKYFYSKSGKITARLANGKLQHYKYDANGQVLVVLGENCDSIEEYVYDPSGNILQKTILGKTTTYTYDAANQLVSSVSPDGKETNYAYDAAGRMIQEGDKNYKYAWLDKVMQVSENGKTLANFEYHNSGQIAKAIRGDNVETFEWDGLALIERSGTKYINEPHAGGGNPVLAMGESSGDVMFNDILGTSLGVVKDGGYSAIDKTSFGADSNDKSSFFTGKPYIEDLGYAFLFRNYRADLGKWQMRDLIGYPDGWNNLAYCGNLGLSSVDLFGALTIRIMDANANNAIVSNSTALTVGSTDAPEGAFRTFDFSFSKENNEVFANIKVAINLSKNAKMAKDVEGGTSVRYVPHGNSSFNNGIITVGVYEAMLAHERGHADAFFRYYIPALNDALQKIVDETKTIDEINNSCNLFNEYQKVDDLYDKDSARLADANTFAYFNINRRIWKPLNYNKWEKKE